MGVEGSRSVSDEVAGSEVTIDKKDGRVRSVGVEGP